MDPVKPHIQLLFPGQTLKRALPENFREQDADLFYLVDFVCEVHEVHLRKFEQARVLHDFIFVNGNPVYGYSRRTVKLRIELFKQRLKFYAYRKIKMEHAFLAVNQWGNNYFHWLTELLPAILACKKVQPQLPILMPVGYRHCSFITDAMHILQITPLYYLPRQQLIIKELFAINLPVVGHYNPSYLQLVHEWINEHISVKAKTYRKVYVSRQKASRRKVLNEDLLINLLLQYGFEMICFEDLSFIDQVKLMQETSVLLSSHGAGLANMMFMPKGGVIIELKADNNDYNCFYTLADACYHRYFFLLCKPDVADHRASNIQVDLEEMETILNSN